MNPKPPLASLIRAQFGSIARAARFWDVSRQTIYAWIEKGEITAEGARHIRAQHIDLDERKFPVAKKEGRRGRPRSA